MKHRLSKAQREMLHRASGTEMGWALAIGSAQQRCAKKLESLGYVTRSGDEHVYITQLGQEALDKETNA